jgi:AsmA protein
VRISRWISIGAGALIALGVVAVVVITQVVDPNRYRGTIERRFEAATGRALQLEGDIDLAFYPWLALTTGAARIAGPAGTAEQPFVGWREARVGARLVPLLRGELVVDRIRIVGLDARLVKRADGSNNYSLQPSSGEGPAPDIAGLELRGSRIEYRDEGSGLRVMLADVSLDAEPLRANTPIAIELESAVEGGGKWRAQVALAGRFSPGPPAVVELPEWSLSAGPARLKGSASVTLGTPLHFEANAKMAPASLRETLASQGIDLPPTRDKHALGAFEVAASVRLDDAGLDVEPLTLRLDDTRFAGRLARTPGEDGVIEFALAGDSLDVDRYLKPEGVESEPFVLPTEALKALQARGEVTLETVMLDSVRMTGVALRLELENGAVRAESAAPQR